MGILAMLGGAGALLLGLLTDGPFKGVLKILSKLGIQGGIKMLMAGAKAFIGTLSKFVTAPFKMVSKLFGKGIMGKLLGFLKPLGKIFKRIPLIGSIISIGFAISRFNKGQNVRGVIDVLSAVVGLLDFVAPGVGFALSFGLDMLNVWMDMKMADPKNKGKSEMDVLGEIGKTIGNWIWKNALWIPVIGGFKRMQMSWDAFKGGNIKGGLYQFGAALLSFGGLGPIVTGIEMLMGFGEKKESDKSLSPKTGWFSGLKAWIKKKLKDLPWVLRKPLEWFGILDDSDEDTSNKPSIVNSVYDKLKKFASSMWSGITSSLALVGDLLVKGVTTLYNNVKQTLSDAASAVKNAAVEVHNKQVKKYRGLAEKDASTRVVESVKNPFGTIYGAGAEIVALGASRRDAAASEEAFSKKQKELIKRGILNPDGTPRSREERVKSGLAKPLPTQDKTVVSDAIKTVKIPQKTQDKTVVSDAIKTVKIPQKTQDKTVVSDTPNPNALPVVQSGNSQSLEFLRNIGMTQIKIMGDIKGIAAQILKKMDSSMGGSNSNTVVPISQPPSSQKSSPMPMNSNRGDYGSSAYALA
jgi:hypothetical protein